MASAPHKAQTLANDLASKLAIRLTNLGALKAVVGNDGSGNPTIVVGTGVAGTAGAFIVIKQEPWPLALDSLGNAAIGYGPLLVQMAEEAGSALTYVNSIAQHTALLGQLVLPAVHIQLFHSANGTFPVSGSITGTADADFTPDPQYALVGNG